MTLSEWLAYVAKLLNKAADILKKANDEADTAA